MYPAVLDVDVGGGYACAGTGVIPQRVSLLLIHIELLHIGYYRVGGECPCVIEWVLVIYFINSNVHILV